MVCGFLFSAVASAAPPYVVVAYVPNDYNSNPNYLFRIEDIPWGDISHIYESFAVVNGTTLTFQRRIGVIEEAHNHGVRVYLSVGGASSTSWPTSTAQAQTLANAIVALMNQGTDTNGTVAKYDGVDIDWEYPTNAAVFTALLSDLRTGLNAITPGLAPSGSYPVETSLAANTSHVGLTFFLPGAANMCNYGLSPGSGSASSADWGFVGGYDFNIGVGGDLCQGPLTQTGYSTNSGCEGTLNLDVSSLVNGYINLGLPAAQMVLGCPLYARGADGTPSSPIVNVLTGTAGARDASGDEITYTYGGTQYGADDAQSFCTKITWAKNKGIAGIGLWDAGMALPINANAGVSAIWDTVGGNTSCVTGGCKTTGCTPTPVPTATPACGVKVDDLESGMFTNYLGGIWTASMPPAGDCGGPPTMNPLYVIPSSGATQWFPSYGYGLGGSDIGARLYGTNAAAGSSTLCYGSPALICSFGAGTAPAYNGTTNGATGLQFRIKLGSAPSFPATVTALVYSNAGQKVTPVNWAEYYYNVVVTAANQEMLVTIPFTSLTAPSTGTPYTFDPTSLQYIAWRVGYWGGTYDFTVDDVWFTCASASTPTFTPVPTMTPTKTVTPTPSRTPTATNSPTSTVTPTNSPTKTSTITPTNTAVNTATFTSTMTNSPTKTITITPTNTIANTGTFTSTFTSTMTATYSPTKTATVTLTLTPSLTNTGTPTNTKTFTVTSTSTPSFTPTWTPTKTLTATFTGTPTFTTTITNTPLFSYTPTFTGTLTNTATHTLTMTVTSSATNTGTPTPTRTPTMTNTFTPSFTSTYTMTNTGTPTFTGTPTLSSTITNTPFFSATPTFTGTSTSTTTLTPPSTSTVTQTFTPSPTKTFTTTSTSTATSTNTFTPISTPTPTFTFTVTSTKTPTATSTLTMTLTDTRTATFTATSTSSSTPTSTPTITRTSTPLPTITFTSTATKETISTPVIYPNPGKGGPVSIHVPHNKTCDVQVELFTVAFRKVQDQTFSQTPVGEDVVVKMDDRWGNPLASGLYYVVVTTPQGRTVTKLLLLR